MAYEQILYRVDNKVAVVTLNRPERLNAWTPVMHAEVKAAMRAATDDPEVRVVVLSGAGRGFCAGADMSILSRQAQAGRARSGQAELADVNSTFASTIGPDLSNEFRDAERFGYFIKTKKPVIAAINGPVAGIGLVMVLYADLRFAADNAVFTTSFAQRGLVAEHGMAWLLPKLVGPSNALDLLLSARKIGAAEALRMGLVTGVYPHGSFMQEVRAYARMLTDTVSPRSMAVMKAQVWKAGFQDFNESLAVADAEMKASLEGPEFKEGVAHFLERRAPNFADL
jgi:enoyl-CoA hydratase/carnithine racemase